MFRKKIIIDDEVITRLIVKNMVKNRGSGKIHGFSYLEWFRVLEKGTPHKLEEYSQNLGWAGVEDLCLEGCTLLCII